MNPVKLVIRRFDDWLSRVEHVEPFADDPAIILRLQDSTAAWDIALPEHTVARGSPVMVLHWWNDRMPPLSMRGADLQWAIRFHRQLVYSLRAAARHMQQWPEAREIQAVGGIIVQIHLEPADGGRILTEHLGFTVFPYHRPAGAFGEFWENFYTWLLMWTYNPGSLRSHALLGLQRNEFWMTKERFLERFGSEPEETGTARDTVLS